MLCASLWGTVSGAIGQRITIWDIRTTPTCKSPTHTVSGVHSRSYQFWYAGTSLQRQLGQQFSAFVSYQFNDIGIGQCSGTPNSTACGLNSTRHTGMVGINWHPRPFRLD